MLRVALILAVVFWGGVLRADAPPVVEEFYDEVILLHETCGGGEHTWDVHRLIFIRDNKVIAVRSCYDNIHTISTDEYGFVLSWDDYSTAFRVVHFKSFVDMCGSMPEEDPQAAWWNMAVLRTDLKAP